MNIDAHQHFWIYDEREYGWMGAGMEALKRDHLPGDLWPSMQAAGIEGTVAVQARQNVEETRWLLDLADRHPFIRGVVGWVDLRSPQLGEQLARLAAHPRLRGVRHVVHDEPDDRFLLREDVMRGIGALAGWGLTYDLLLFPRHLPVACELVARYPEQPFVLDHIAKPRIRAGLLEPWATDIRRLAAFPNVCCKVSGMVTEADWAGWQAADFRPYLDVVFEAFGPQRLMIGSDWPVCTVAGAYERVLQIVIEAIAQLSADERAAMMGGTATRFYGLE
jgi:L-fuconolactonase